MNRANAITIAVSSRKRVSLQVTPYFVAYVLTIAAIIGYSLLDKTYQSWADAGGEYALYLRFIQEGAWQSHGLLLDASVVTTLFPALIARMVPLEPLIIFKVYNAAIMAFLPLAIFRLAKSYGLNLVWSIVAAAFIAVQFHFARAPMFSRVIVASLFWCVLLIALRSDWKYRLLVIAGTALLLVLSHYTTAFLALAALFLTLIFNRDKGMVVAIAGLAASIIGWYGFFARTPLVNAKNVISQVTATSPFTYVQGSWQMGLVSDWQPLQVLAFVGFWLAIAACIVGLVSHKQGRAIASAGLVPIAGYYLYPSMSAIYDFPRMVFFSLIALSPFFALGIKWMYKRGKTWAYTLSVIILLSYFISDIAQAIAVALVGIVGINALVWSKEVSE